MGVQPPLADGGVLGPAAGQSRRPIICLGVVLVPVSIFQLFSVRKSLARKAVVLEVTGRLPARVGFVSPTSPLGTRGILFTARRGARVTICAVARQGRLYSAVCCRVLKGWGKALRAGEREYLVLYASSKG